MKGIQRAKLIWWIKTLAIMSLCIFSVVVQTALPSKNWPIFAMYFLAGAAWGVAMVLIIADTRSGRWRYKWWESVGSTKATTKGDEK